MKRLMLYVFAVLIACVQAVATDFSSLPGVWESKKVKVPCEAQNMTMFNQYTFDFATDNSVEMNSVISLSIDMGQKVYVDCYIYVDAKGVYVAQGDSISVKLDESTVNLNVPADEVRVRSEVFIDQVRAEKMKIMVSDNLLSTMNTKQAYAFYKNITLNNVELTAKKMTCDDDGEKIVFNRRKKK